MTTPTPIVPFDAHARAERLVDARLDDDALSAEDDRWLERHLAECEDCRAAAAARRSAVDAIRAEPRLAAPDGFSARVLAAARAEAAADALRPPRRAWGQWALAAAALAAGLALVIGSGPRGASADATGPTGGAGVQTAGAGGAPAGPAAAHLVVRAPSLGPAEVRARVDRIARAHAGAVEGGEGVLFVRMPRRELLGVLQALSRGGELVVERRAELDPAADTVWLRVELE